MLVYCYYVYFMCNFLFCYVLIFFILFFFCFFFFFFLVLIFFFFFFFSSRRRHTRCSRDWSSDVCSSDLYSGSVYRDVLGGQAQAGYWVQGRTRSRDGGDFGHRPAPGLRRGTFLPP